MVLILMEYLCGWVLSQVILKYSVFFFLLFFLWHMADFTQLCLFKGDAKSWFSGWNET